MTHLLIEAMRHLRSRLLQTSLSALGIFVGIASIAMMLAVGESVEGIVAKQLDILGRNLLIIAPQASANSESTSLELPVSGRDIPVLMDVPGVANIAPVLGSRLPLRFIGGHVDAAVLATTSSMFQIRDWHLLSGDIWDESSDLKTKRVAVIGRDLAEMMFFRTDPLHKMIVLGSVPFEVIGVLSETGRSFDGTDLGSTIVIPISAGRAFLGLSSTLDGVHYLLVQQINPQASAVKGIKEALRDSHRLRPDADDNFAVTDLASISQSGGLIASAVAMLLGVLASISLIVGGVGIMNMMLMSVAERTKELALRRALGATKGSIIAQLLIEALLICGIGAIAGIVLAEGITLAISAFTEFKIEVSLKMAVLSVAFAALVGLVFGLAPAVRASRLMPAVGLRSG